MEWPLKKSVRWDGSFFLLQRKYRYSNRTVVDLDGIARDGSSVRLTVHGFEPRFYLRFDVPGRSVDSRRAESLLAATDSAVREWMSGPAFTGGRVGDQVGWRESLILSAEVVECGDNASHLPDDRFEFVEVKVCHPQVVSYFSNFLAYPHGRSAGEDKWSFAVPRWADASLVKNVVLYDSNVDFDVVFGSRTPISTCRWYFFDSLNFRPKERRLTRFDFEFEAVHWSALTPSDCDDRPPIESISFDIEVRTDGREFPDPKRDPVLQICAYLHVSSLGKFKTAAWTLGDVNRGKVPLDYDHTGFALEEEMLSDFGDFYVESAPHFVGAHNGCHFDLRYLFKRAKHLNLTDFPSKFTRIYGQKPWHKKDLVKHFTRWTYHLPGHTVFDTMTYRRNMPDPYDCTLKECAKQFLGQNNKIDLPHERINAKQKTRAGRTDLLRYCMKDAELVMRLAEVWNMEPTIFSWARMGTPPLKFLTREVTPRVECALMEDFGRLNKVYPDRKFSLKRVPLEIPRSPTGKPIQGAITIEHKIGYYASDFPPELRAAAPYVRVHVVICLDFASLYPSLIMQLNIGTDTVGHRSEFEALGLVLGRDFDYVPVFGGEPHPDAPCFLKAHVKKSVIAAVEETLKKLRRSVKAELKKERDLIVRGEGSESRAAELDAYQLAIKSVMNSLYGLHVTEVSRLYNLAVGWAITAGGRYYLQFSEYFIFEKWKYPVIAGDTDSLMLAIEEGGDGDAAMTEISETLNPLLGEHLDFAPEKRFISSVFCGAKKHYYVLMALYGEPDEKAFIKIKGCTFFKKKTCALVRDACMKAVEIVLRGRPERRLTELVECLRAAVRRLSRGEVMIHELVETQKLSKDVRKYGTTSPAVAVALREWKEACARAAAIGSAEPPAPGAGRIVTWIVCADPSQKLISPRARSPEEVSAKNLPPDASHYRKVIVGQFASYFAVPYLALSGRDPNPPSLKNMSEVTDKDKERKWKARHIFYEAEIKKIVSGIPTYSGVAHDVPGSMTSFFSRKRKEVPTTEREDLESRLACAMRACETCANDSEDIESCGAWRCENLGARKYCERKLANL